MDKKFKVTHSLLSTQSVRELLNDYDLNVISCEFLTRGLNDTYFITTQNKKYIYRVYRHNWRSESDILFELDAINWLKDEGLFVSTPVKTMEGNRIVSIQAPEGNRYGVLFTYSPGERPLITEENCHILGKSLAKLHQKSSSLISPNQRSFELDINHLLAEPASLITPILERHLKAEQVQSFYEMVTNLEIKLRESKLEYGFCHGDFHNFNMHIHNQELEVFDFDCCGFGYRAYDLAVFWWNLKNNYRSLEKACWDEFLNGYLSRGNLAEVDLRSLPLFVSMRRIWLLGTMLKNEDVWGTNWISPTNLSHFLMDLSQDSKQY
ncbi:Ser/Thr protein kinase RdoA (MazF antagonist) [Bacillus sp. SLBN-46]|uniref:phosphotransferase enzyme family protein n=1 Tax=Bacillus sp. SLBN-46 TaxID=3042283 RepID=UPI002858BEAC|nr:phosphotransferase [Bacillus sp. SLBN-46]MDR6121600.1 Ser/Thr protein kinase RdoA (MazF antagonist) [Bacillus sp. SLBN-46]